MHSCVVCFLPDGQAIFFLRVSLRTHCFQSMYKARSLNITYSREGCRRSAHSDVDAR